MRKKNYVVRQKIYNFLCMGYHQNEIAFLLERQGYNGKRSRVSQIVKELVEDGYIRLKVKSRPNFYVPTRRKYPPCHTLKEGGFFKHCHGRMIKSPENGQARVHNQCIIFDVVKSSLMFDGDRKSLNAERQWFGWDLIEKKRGITRYMYKSKDATLIRTHGKFDDSIEIFILDDVWDIEELDSYEDWLEEQVQWWRLNLQRFFGVMLKFRKVVKPHFAIRPLSSEMGRTFMESNVTVGDVHGDASHGFPELEFMGDFSKTIEQMKLIDRMTKAVDEDKKRNMEGMIAYG